MNLLKAYRAIQNMGIAAVLLGTTFLPSLLGQDQAFASGFTRRESDPDNVFYELIDEFQQFANQESKSLNLDEVGARALDPNKLTLKYDHDITIYFLNEGAGFRNQLGIIATGKTERNEMVFKDITCVEDCSFTGYRSPYGIFGTPDGQPLAIGDYYQLGLIEGGTSLDFFLRQDGFGRQHANIWYTDTILNSDGLQHVMAYDFQDYLVLAWEDLTHGGDQDYNDVVFAIDFGEANLRHLDPVKVPESAMSMLCYAVVGVAGIFFSRKPSPQEEA